jgi:transketolase
MEKSIHAPSRLAPNPNRELRYRTSVRLKTGENLEVADPTATRALVALMDMQAVLGGAASHFGGPSAFAELMSALHGLVFHEASQKNLPWHELFHILNDAGHCENGLYALKANYGFADLTLDSLKGFRSIQSQLTGHGEAHIFPEAVYLSNGPLGSCLPQTQGLSFADRLSGRSRVTVTAISDGGCMEGEAREALVAIPGLAAKGRMNPYVLIISDNNTKLSGRIDQDAFSMESTFSTLSAFGWKTIRLDEGHNLQKCVTVLEEAFAAARANPNQPVAVHAKTIKGYGTAKTEQSASGGHGFPLSDPKDLLPFIQEIYKGQPVPTEFQVWAQELVENKKLSAASAPSGVATGVKSEKVQVGVSQALIKKRKEGRPVVSISSDLGGSTGVAGFHKEFPQFSQDVGVAEANMISMAAGLSREGYVAVVDTFAQFGVTKGALPLTMAALSEAPVIGIFSHVGFQDAADGASHQALAYIAMTAAIPHTDVYCLSSSAEAESLVGQAVDEIHEAYKRGQVAHNKIFFLGRENFPQRYLPADYSYKLGEAQVVFDNTQKFSGRLTIVAAGAMLHQALEAAYKLDEQKIGVCVVNPSVINHPDISTLRTCLRNTGGNLLTVEDHQITGGMGSLLIHALQQNDLQVRAHSLGVRGEFGQSAYNAIDLYRKHGLDAEAILKAAMKLAKADKN